MYFIASKVLAFIADPFTWFLILFVVGLFRLWKYGKGKRSLVSSLVLIFVLTNPFLSNLAIRYWEPDTYSADSITKPYDVGVLLSGATRGLDQSAQRPLYGPGVDRVLQTIELYQKGKIKKIILTGGSGSLEFPEQKESYWTMKLLKDFGVPDSVLFLEGESRNTRENAQFTSKLIQENPELKGRMLLITSAFHMRRAMGCFSKANLKFDIYPVDSGKSILSFNPYRIIIPDIYAIHVWDQLIRECIGMATYYFMGYI
ncbi:MAG: hypothetical protein RL491_1090 [Bacteroidota bacterium]|jgi:uncharacterized SAM-binding protein YcdF (DUF218 family)